MAFKSLLIETINCDSCGKEEENIVKDDNQGGRPDYIETEIFVTVYLFEVGFQR